MGKRNLGLETTVGGMDMQHYMAYQLEQIEKDEVAIEQGKLKVAFLKQMNNHSRLMLDAAKFELKEKEFNFLHPTDCDSGQERQTAQKAAV